LIKFTNYITYTDVPNIPTMLLINIPYVNYKIYVYKLLSVRYYLNSSDSQSGRLIINDDIILRITADKKKE